MASSIAPGRSLLASPLELASIPKPSTSIRSRRNRASVDTTKAFGANPDAIMQGARRQFLAVAGKDPDDQDAALAPWRPPLDCLTQLIHAGGTSGQDALRRAMLEFLHLSRFVRDVSSALFRPPE